MIRFCSRALLLVLWLPCFLATAPGQDHPETVDLRIEKGTLLQLLERTARDLRMGLVVDADSTEKMQEPITLFALETPWAKALDLFRHQYGLEITIDDGLLLVSDAQRARLERLEMRLYDLRPLINGISNFPGPQLGISRGAGPVSAIADTSPPEFGQVIEMIELFSTPDSWMEQGTGIEEYNGTLAISNLPEVHEQISALLREMERNRATLINATVYLVDEGDEFPAKISAANWPAVRAELGHPVGNVLLRSGQRNHLASAISYNRISGYGEDQGRLIPEVGRIGEGLVVDLTLQRSEHRGLISTARIQAIEPAILSPRAMNLGDDELTPWEQAQQVNHGRGDTRLLEPGGASVHTVGDSTVIIHYEVIADTGEEGR